MSKKDVPENELSDYQRWKRKLPPYKMGVAKIFKSFDEAVRSTGKAVHQLTYEQVFDLADMSHGTSGPSRATSHNIEIRKAYLLGKIEEVPEEALIEYLDSFWLDNITLCEFELRIAAVRRAVRKTNHEAAVEALLRAKDKERKKFIRDRKREEARRYREREEEARNICIRGESHDS